MSPVRDLLVDTIDYLHEPEQKLLLEIAQRFVPDYVATPKDILDIQQADRDFASGEYFTDEDINWK